MENNTKVITAEEFYELSKTNARLDNSKELHPTYRLIQDIFYNYVFPLYNHPKVTMNKLMELSHHLKIMPMNILYVKTTGNVYIDMYIVLDIPNITLYPITVLYLGRCYMEHTKTKEKIYKTRLIETKEDILKKLEYWKDSLLKIHGYAYVYNQLKGINYKLQTGDGRIWLVLNFHKIELTEHICNVNLKHYINWEKGIMEYLTFKKGTHNRGHRKYQLKEAPVNSQYKWIIQGPKGKPLPDGLYTFLKNHDYRIIEVHDLKYYGNVDHKDPEKSNFPLFFKPIYK